MNHIESATTMLASRDAQCNALSVRPTNNFCWQHRCAASCWQDRCAASGSCSSTQRTAAGVVASGISLFSVYRNSGSR